jgi:hypothetical protein
MNLIQLGQYAVHLGGIGLAGLLPRRNAVDLNALACPFITEGFGHLHHCSLRCRVDASILVRLERGHRRNVDDLAGSVQRQEFTTKLLA